MATYDKSSVVKGHHIYKFVWTPVIGQELNTKLEEDNGQDKHAVAVMLDDQIVGHLPQSISRVSRLFLRCGVLLDHALYNYPGIYWRPGDHLCRSTLAPGIYWRPGAY